MVHACFAAAQLGNCCGDIHEVVGVFLLCLFLRIFLFEPKLTWGEAVKKMSPKKGQFTSTAPTLIIRKFSVVPIKLGKKTAMEFGCTWLR